MAGTGYGKLLPSSGGQYKIGLNTPENFKVILWGMGTQLLGLSHFFFLMFQVSTKDSSLIF